MHENFLKKVLKDYFKHKLLTVANFSSIFTFKNEYHRGKIKFVRK